MSWGDKWLFCPNRRKTDCASSVSPLHPNPMGPLFAANGYPNCGLVIIRPGLSRCNGLLEGYASISFKATIAYEI